MLQPNLWTSLCAGVAGLIVLSQTPSLLAVPIATVPNPHQADGTWVADTANLIDPATKVQLNRLISQLEAHNGSEIAIVTVPNTAPSRSPKAFATQLFNTWKIGKQAKNNGVLVLISKGDRRVEIETGSGLTTQLPDAVVKQILDQQVMPQFRQGQFSAGTLAGTQALVAHLENAEAAHWSGYVLGGMGAGAIAAIVILLVRRSRRRPLRQTATRKSISRQTKEPDQQWTSSHYHGSSMQWSSTSSDSSSVWSSSSSDSGSSSSSSSSSSDSSWSSSGSDFGGGSSDGGGAGGSW